MKAKLFTGLFILVYATAVAQNSASKDGNYYYTTKINYQEWTSLNLNVSIYRNSDSIPCARSKNEWDNYAKEKKGCYADYENNSVNSIVLGKFYNWYAVNDPRGLAPEGYHIPTKAEWDELIDFLKIRNSNSRVFKANYGWGISKIERYGISYESGYSISSEFRTLGNGTNSSGFSAIPAGYIQANGKHYGLGECAHWWTRDGSGSSKAKAVVIANFMDSVNTASFDKDRGNSIRLIKD